MSHRKNAGAEGLPLVENHWQASRSTTEWEADTDVMPPEYCQQLLKISRQLKQEE
jgi:hypothetical protein